MALRVLILEFTYCSHFNQHIFSVLQSEVIDLNNPNNPLQITAINTSSLNGTVVPHISMTIPLELLRVFNDGVGEIRIVSAVYRNISSIFSNGIGLK